MSLNVVPFPNANLNDIAAMARRLADGIDAGEFGEVNSCVVVMESDSGLTSFGWGDAPDAFRVIGLLEAGKAEQLRSLFDES